jgi:hypothetical protein
VKGAPVPVNRRHSTVSTLAAISGLYDFGAGAFLLFGGGVIALLGVPRAQPPIFSDLNALFLLAVGAGYYLPWRDPGRYRGYLWVMGVGLKSAGAFAFALDYVVRGSPAIVLLFGGADAAVSIATLMVLISSRAPKSSGGSASG